MSPSVARIVRRFHDADVELKQSIPRFLGESSLFSFAIAPLLYSLLLPLALLDLWVTLYQWACFPVYRMPCVQRRRYFVTDRHRLAYLNGIEKVNCTYCSYANGLIAYVREIAACTELYWCPIKHAREIPSPHSRYRGFLDYGDAEGYRRELGRVRQIRPRRAQHQR